MNGLTFKTCLLISLSISSLMLMGLKLPWTPAEWSYKGENGPENWGELSRKWETCSNGTMQSPTDFKSQNVSKKKNRVKFFYEDTPADAFLINGKVEFHAKGDNEIEFDNVRYKLSKLVFHHPSEHSIDGKRASASIQMHHSEIMQDKNTTGQTLIMEILLNTGIVNVVLARLKPHFKFTEEEKPAKEYKFFPARFLPRTANKFFYYKGSQTEPPCLEEIHWVVFRDPLDVSQKQLKFIESITSPNSRPVQKSKDITVYKTFE